MKERVCVIECSECGNITKKPQGSKISMIEAEAKLLDINCSFCNCNDSEKLEKYVIEREINEKTIGRRPTH